MNIEKSKLIQFEKETKPYFDLMNEILNNEYGFIYVVDDSNKILKEVVITDSTYKALKQIDICIDNIRKKIFGNDIDNKTMRFDQ